MIIKSRTNSSVKEARDILLHSATRRSLGLFSCEGLRLMRDVIKSGMTPKRVFYTEDFLKKEGDSLICGEENICVSSEVMDYLSDTKTPQGILGIFHIPHYDITDLLGESPLVLILEDLRDPGNMGTIFRSFEAAGGSGIILTKGCTDPTGPKCIRSTMGSIARLPFIISEDVKEAINLLISAGVQIFAAHMEGEDYTCKDYNTGTAFIIGNEANGLSDGVWDMGVKRVMIPMSGSVESLNAAVTAAVLSFEANRQRRLG